MRSLLAALSLGASLLGACTLPGNHYDPTPDTALPKPDAPVPDAHQVPIQLLVTPVSTTIHEGGTSSVMVSLSGPPAGAFVVMVQSNDKAVDVSLPELVFDDVNYGIPQVVTLTGAQDT